MRGFGGGVIGVGVGVLINGVGVVVIVVFVGELFVSLVEMRRV